jgi:hypothetical protein
MVPLLVMERRVSVRSNSTAVLMVGACAVVAGVFLKVIDVRAQSSSVKTVFDTYGLLGIFSFDCSKPPTSNNYYYVHRLVGPGHVQRDRMSGGIGRDYVNVIDKASAIGPNQVSISGMRIEGNRKGGAIEEIWRVEPSRIMTVDGTLGGLKLISGGRFNGQPVPWANRCPSP